MFYTGKSYKSVSYQLLLSIHVYILIPQGILYCSFKKQKKTKNPSIVKEPSTRKACYLEDIKHKCFDGKALHVFFFLFFNIEVM